jgi:hypothetical protein
MARMTKTLVPKRKTGSSEESRGRLQKLQRIERTGAVTPNDLSPRTKILNRTAKRVKLHRIIVIRRKLAYQNKVLNKTRRNKGITKMKITRKIGNASGSNRKKVPITDNNMRWR